MNQEVMNLFNNPAAAQNFDSIRISIASPELIRRAVVSKETGPPPSISTSNSSATLQPPESVIVTV